MGDGGRDGDDLRRQRRWGKRDRVPVPRGFGRDGDGVLAAGGEGKEVICSKADEGMAVLVKGSDEVGKLETWLGFVLMFA